MNMSGSSTPGSSHTLWHIKRDGKWAHYFSRLLHPNRTPPATQPPVRMTRRQELLAAQEQRRREKRAHVLELLRDVKDKHQDGSPLIKLKA